ncbi:uncharacterized protein LOC125824625 [Solanum verrucosum]|uniref:uncharacterized protein LOC125824625 n=1 Tax=Solanum verrucosum TaxID=315347 RepID=UPI0020D02FA4|nr:uncharacterized protein LOC125824625 [Solanum verrucosum]
MEKTEQSKIEASIDRNKNGGEVGVEWGRGVVEWGGELEVLIFLLLFVKSFDPKSLDEQTKKLFLEDLDEAIRDILNTEKIFIGGDFNGHIGVTSSGFDNIQGAFDYGERNRGGASLPNFVEVFELKGDKGLSKDCKVNPNENLTIQHKLLLMDLEIKRDKIKKTIYDRPMIRWGGLTLTFSREMGEKLIGMRG